MGVVAGFCAIMLLMQGPHLKNFNGDWRIKFLHILFRNRLEVFSKLATSSYGIRSSETPSRFGVGNAPGGSTPLRTYTSRFYTSRGSHMPGTKENKVKKKLREGQVATVLGGLNNPEIIDYMGQFGFDGAWIETEHGTITWDQVAHMSRGAIPCFRSRCETRGEPELKAQRS